jgi:hypothetical protein
VVFQFVIKAAFTLAKFIAKTFTITHRDYAYLLLPFPPWATRHKWKWSYLCCTTQGGQWKYVVSCVSISLAVLPKNFANVNVPLKERSDERINVLKGPKTFQGKLRIFGGINALD